MHKITLLSRPGCHLCAQVRESIDKLVSMHADVLIDEIDIDQNAELRDKYHDVVPVVLVDGQERFREVVDPDALAKLFYDDFSQKLLGF
jgi:glutaredoxin